MDALLNMERRTGVRSREIDDFLARVEDVEETMKALKSGDESALEEMEREQEARKRAKEAAARREAERIAAEIQEEKDKWWRRAEYRFGERVLRPDDPAADDNAPKVEELDEGNADSVEGQTEGEEAVNANEGRYSLDYSRWDKWTPTDPVSQEEVKAREEEEERRRNEAFEQANKEFCDNFKADVERREHTRQAQEAEAKAKRLRGNNFFKKRQWQKALDCYMEALDLESFDVAILTNIAQAHLRMENYERAIEFCDRALHVNPEHIKALSRRAVAFGHVKQLHHAVEDVERMMELDPENPDVVRQYRETTAAFEDYREEQALLESVKRKNTKSKENGTDSRRAKHGKGTTSQEATSSDGDAGNASASANDLALSDNGAEASVENEGEAEEAVAATAVERQLKQWMRSLPQTKVDRVEFRSGGTLAQVLQIMTDDLRHLRAGAEAKTERSGGDSSSGGGEEQKQAQQQTDEDVLTSAGRLDLISIVLAAMQDDRQSKRMFAQSPGMRWARFLIVSPDASAAFDPPSSASGSDNSGGIIGPPSTTTGVAASRKVAVLCAQAVAWCVTPEDNLEIGDTARAVARDGEWILSVARLPTLLQPDRETLARDIAAQKQGALMPRRTPGSQFDLVEWMAVLEACAGIVRDVGSVAKATWSGTVSADTDVGSKLLSCLSHSLFTLTSLSDVIKEQYQTLSRLAGPVSGQHQQPQQGQQGPTAELDQMARAAATWQSEAMSVACVNSLEALTGAMANVALATEVRTPFADPTQNPLGDESEKPGPSPAAVLLLFMLCRHFPRVSQPARVFALAALMNACLEPTGRVRQEVMARGGCDIATAIVCTRDRRSLPPQLFARGAGLLGRLSSLAECASRLSRVEVLSAILTTLVVNSVELGVCPGVSEGSVRDDFGEYRFEERSHLIRVIAASVRPADDHATALVTAAPEAHNTVTALSCLLCALPSPRTDSLGVVTADTVSRPLLVSSTGNSVGTANDAEDGGVNPLQDVSYQVVVGNAIRVLIQVVGVAAGNQNKTLWRRVKAQLLEGQAVEKLICSLSNSSNDSIRKNAAVVLAKLMQTQDAAFTDRIRELRGMSMLQEIGGKMGET